ncbi:TonB-dependent receptor domain-containing protein [Alteromonas sp. RKMC-009]|uniref:TonB-dependent receptor domain-containing protein n=1 Tax=Alteromonas sp. RKMC-009 TaxID=2267264 RepID=UPI000E69F54D|nr:TonB-dependent receptor [Alteromonas sp. RKMC-009]AYA65217.1 TonB-dependent receptor [Alteromonas sp. RKMC-009]
MNKRYAFSRLALAVSAVIASPVFAQDNTDAETQDKAKYEQIVVTATPGGATMQEASVSVSSFNEDDIVKLAPRSTAEVFRAIPGIRAESSGGGGNANITIRGIPLATGGSKFLQIHEDGLPVLEYGDINFGNADNFIRYDWSVANVEAVRGGSASTFASNSPGGVINMISNTGEIGGGAIGTSFGVDYDEMRLDFRYGGEISDDLYYHIAGFARGGEGTRDTGYHGDKGGQVKFNITKLLDNGHIRFFYKNLDDKVSTYLPSPVLVKGDGEYGPVPGFDASSQALNSVYNTNISTFDSYGNPENRDVRDGISSEVNSFGVEVDLEVADNLFLLNKFRISDVSGGFIAPFTDGFPAGPGDVSNFAAALCSGALDGEGNALNCDSTTVTLANGPGAGEVYTGEAFTNLQFDARLNDLGNMINDLSLRKEFDNGVSLTVGYYYSNQDIATSWASWQTFIQTLDGDNSQLLNITDADGTELVSNGLLSASFLSYEWDLNYVTTAPYMNVGFELSDNILIDASVRYDSVDASGELISSCCGGNADYDINGNGVIEQIEDASAQNSGFISGGVINLNRAGASSQIVDYSANNTSYSLGGSYLLSETQTLFARYSKGGRALADRLLQIGGTLNTDGSLTNTTSGFDTTKQLEIGYKYGTRDLMLNATLFDTVTEDTQAEVTSGLTFMREYEATGLEFEGRWNATDNFVLSGNLTWTDAEISKDANDAALVGNTPRRQADWIWTITPEYVTDFWSVGASLQGSTEYYVQDNNDLKQDAYNLVNVFATYWVNDQFSVSLNVNNATDEFVITESEEGSAAVGSYIRARPLNGRTTVVSLKYLFD